MVTKKRDEDEIRPEEEFAPEPPLRDKKHGLPNFGGETVKTVIISLVVTFVMIMGLGYAGGGSFLTKKDFEKNMVGFTTAMDSAKAGLAQAQSSVATAVQVIPTTVSTQVANSVAQATGQWNSQLTALSEKVTISTTSNQANATKITELSGSLTSNVSTLTAKDTELAGKISALETKATDYEKRIKVLEDKVAQLQPSGTTPSASGITIVATSLQSNTIFATSGTYYYTLSIANSNNIYKKVRIQVLATPSAVISGMPLINVTSAVFTASGGFAPDGTFATTVTPATSTTGIIGVSNGYLYVGTGTTPIVITLTYTATGTYGWDMTFSPIVIP